jgi:hypothetical protein
MVEPEKNQDQVDNESCGFHSSDSSSTQWLINGFLLDYAYELLCDLRISRFFAEVIAIYLLILKVLL